MSKPLQPPPPSVSCFLAALRQDLQAASREREREKDAYLFLLFVLLKSCALHPFYCCLQGAADGAELCTRLSLCLPTGPFGAQGGGAVVPVAAPMPLRLR